MRSKSEIHAVGKASDLNDAGGNLSHFGITDNRQYASIQCQQNDAMSSRYIDTQRDSVQGNVHDATKSTSAHAMPDNLRNGLEHLSGYDLSEVEVHYNSLKPAHIGAHAYAQGNEIYLGPQQEKYLPHEGWHVVQQKQGRVNSTMQLASNISVNDDPLLEREADVMGARAVLLNISERISGLENAKITTGKYSNPIQGYFKDDEGNRIKKSDDRIKYVRNVIEKLIANKLINEGILKKFTSIVKDDREKYAVKLSEWVANNLPPIYRIAQMINQIKSDNKSGSEKSFLNIRRQLDAFTVLLENESRVCTAVMDITTLLLDDESKGMARLVVAANQDAELLEKHCKTLLAIVPDDKEKYEKFLKEAPKYLQLIARLKNNLGISAGNVFFEVMGSPDLSMNFGKVLHAEMNILSYLFRQGFISIQNEQTHIKEEQTDNNNLSSTIATTPHSDLEEIKMEKESGKDLGSTSGIMEPTKTLVNEETKDSVELYLSISKKGCAMCSTIIEMLNKLNIVDRKGRRVIIATRGSHRTGYPNWSPEIINLVPELLEQILEPLGLQPDRIKSLYDSLSPEQKANIFEGIYHMVKPLSNNPDLSDSDSDNDNDNESEDEFQTDNSKNKGSSSGQKVKRTSESRKTEAISAQKSLDFSSTKTKGSQSTGSKKTKEDHSILFDKLENIFSKKNYDESEEQYSESENEINNSNTKKSQGLTFSKNAFSMLGSDVDLDDHSSEDSSNEEKKIKTPNMYSIFGVDEDEQDVNEDVSDEKEKKHEKTHVNKKVDQPKGKEVKTNKKKKKKKKKKSEE